MISPRRRLGVWPACLLVLLGMVGGCATMPTSSPVIRGEGGAAGVSQGDPYVRLIPAPPQPGVGEVSLINGFLASAGSFENEHRAARAYLTPEQQSEWDPDGTALVYGDSAALGIDVVESDEAAGTAEVRLSTSLVATISAEGQYLPAERGDVIDTTFELTKVDGEWRIADLPGELLLSSRDVDRVYRSLNLYYFNADDSTLVPDTVLVPGHGTIDLAGVLARRLVSGPTSWLEPAVRTSFPENTRADTAYQSGRLTVDLSDEAAGAGAEQRYEMAAQLSWTLKQVPGIQDVLLRVDGEDMDIPGVPDGPLQPASTVWDRVSPSGMPDGGHAYFMQDGRLWSLTEEQQEAEVPGVAGQENPLEQYAVSLDESRVAGIGGGGSEVLLAGLEEGGEYRTVLSGGTYTALSWDGYGNLWVAEDTDAGGTGDDPDDPDDPDGPEAEEAEEENGEAEERETAPRLWMLRDGTEPVEVRAPELEGAEGSTVTRLRAARDGTRVAVLTTENDATQLGIGRVIADPDAGTVTLDRFIPLAADLDRVIDLAWRGADQLAVLGRSERGPLEAYLVPTGGFTESTSAGATAGAEMETIAAAPNQPLLTGADDGYVWLTNDRLMWDSVAVGANPVYPG